MLNHKQDNTWAHVSSSASSYRPRCFLNRSAQTRRSHWRWGQERARSFWKHALGRGGPAREQDYESRSAREAMQTNEKGTYFWHAQTNEVRRKKMYTMLGEPRGEGKSSLWGEEVSKGPCSIPGRRRDRGCSSFPIPSSPPGLTVRLQTERWCQITAHLDCVRVRPCRWESVTSSACLILPISVNCPSPRGSGPGHTHNAVWPSATTPSWSEAKGPEKGRSQSHRNIKPHNLVWKPAPVDTPSSCTIRTLLDICNP